MNGSLFPLRRRTRLYWFAFRLRWRIKRGWINLVAPYRLHPETLDGIDGDPPHFVRADLAATPAEVVTYLAEQWCLTEREARRGMEPVEYISQLWMVPRYDHTVPEDDERHCWYAEVSADTAGAVCYWRWGDE